MPTTADLDALAGTTWTGSNELWLDPLGNSALTSDATMKIEKGRITYTWSYEGKAQTGVFTYGDRLHWTDTFHMPAGSDCQRIAGAWGLLQVSFEWSMGAGPAWGWRIAFCEREDDGLVLQMTVIKPSGEEGRAVRMSLTRA